MTVIPFSKVVKNPHDTNLCLLCKKDFKEEDLVVQGICNHIFHQECQYKDNDPHHHHTCSECTQRWVPLDQDLLEPYSDQLKDALKKAISLRNEILASAPEDVVKELDGSIVPATLASYSLEKIFSLHNDLAEEVKGKVIIGKNEEALEAIRKFDRKFNGFGFARDASKVYSILSILMTSYGRFSTGKCIPLEVAFNSALCIKLLQTEGFVGEKISYLFELISQGFDTRYNRKEPISTFNLFTGVYIFAVCNFIYMNFVSDDRYKSLDEYESLNRFDYFSSDYYDENAKVITDIVANLFFTAYTGLNAYDLLQNRFNDTFSFTSCKRIAARSYRTLVKGPIDAFKYVYSALVK